MQELIPIPTEVIVRSVLQIDLSEPENIPPEKTGYEIAGYMDRQHRQIVVAQGFRPEYRRFTMAHEIAHWVMHPEIRYHRDRPLSGAERADASRPPEEQEADLFAAELLMPRRLLTDHFRSAFGKQIDGTNPDHELAFWLSDERRAVNEIDLCQNGVRYRALLVATVSHFGPSSYVVPLAKRFGVSPTAMAIQLEDLGLVT